MKCWNTEILRWHFCFFGVEGGKWKGGREEGELFIFFDWFQILSLYFEEEGEGRKEKEKEKTMKWEVFCKIEIKRGILWLNTYLFKCLTDLGIQYRIVNVYHEFFIVITLPYRTYYFTYLSYHIIKWQLKQNVIEFSILVFLSLLLLTNFWSQPVTSNLIYIDVIPHSSTFCLVLTTNDLFSRLHRMIAYQMPVPLHRNSWRSLSSVSRSCARFRDVMTKSETISRSGLFSLLLTVCNYRVILIFWD